MTDREKQLRELISAHEHHKIRCSDLAELTQCPEQRVRFRHLEMRHLAERESLLAELAATISQAE